MIEIVFVGGKSVWINAALIHTIMGATEGDENSATAVKDTQGTLYLTKEAAPAVAARVASALGVQAISGPKHGSPKPQGKFATPTGPKPSPTGWQG